MPTGIRHDFPSKGVMIEVGDENLEVEEIQFDTFTEEQMKRKFTPIRPVFDFNLKKRLTGQQRYDVKVSLYVYLRDSDDDIDTIDIRYWKDLDWQEFDHVERWKVNPSPVPINGHNYVSYFKVSLKMSGDPPIALGS